jgi:hypothetical protein
MISARSDGASVAGGAWEHVVAIETLPAVVPDLPADVVKAIAGKDNSTVSTLLAQYRTQLAVRRTGLADLRSHLANAAGSRSR